MNGLVAFMNGPAGRAARILLGLALIAWGWLLSGGTTAGLVVGTIGLLPLALGIWGRCLLQLFARPPAKRRA